MGKKKVPETAYYGIHTQRSIENFPISGLVMPANLIKAIAAIKQACALANKQLGFLDAKRTNAIVRAAAEIQQGRFADQFPLDIFQAGSGTSTNMNVNEVIANRANQLLGGKKGQRSLVHPNDHVNKGQSTNNVIPSAIRIAARRNVEQLLASLSTLQKALKKKANEFRRIIKAGRTHLQDAVPISLGQEFNAYATSVGKHILRLKRVQPFLSQLGVGGNAVGTGLNTHPSFRELIIKNINKITGFRFSVTKDGIETTHSLTDLAELSSQLKLLAIDLNKIANDLRLLSSGPMTGLHEINLPAVEPGSSIMPGKINPSIAEAVNMACHKIIGNDATITLSAASGQLELNTHMPVVGYALLESLEIMNNAAKVFSEKCIEGITVNREQCRWYVEHSMAMATALNPYIGYDKAAKIVKEAAQKGKTIQEIAAEQKVLPVARLNRILDPKTMIRPNLKKKR